ncbi:MAG: hypothetical protein L0322_30870 [Chloroflexi bacterium]|nr:hypothetical protein [Chloroflexota bacterium]MCI0648920.1 hypothetical protein [Chloroflexota bacterium]
MFKNVITFTALLMALSAIGLLFFPSNMLVVVGIVSNEQMDFLLRTAGTGVASLVPGVWAVRTSTASPVSRAVLTGLVGYLFLSSVVDFYAYTQSIVNTASILSITFRILLGSVILLLMLKERTKR